MQTLNNQSHIFPQQLSQYLLNKYHYKAEKLIGVGLTSSVYQIINQNNKQEKYAVKIYNFNKYQKNKDERIKMIYEIQIKMLKLLQKQCCVVHMYQNGVYQNYGFIIMQLMQGGMLRDHCMKIYKQEANDIQQSSEKCRNFMQKVHRKIKNVLTQLVLILFTLQQYGIIHRDIKFQNLMLNKNGLLKIIDFGSVQLLQQKLQQKVQNKQQLKQILTLNQKLNAKNEYLVGSKHYICPQLISGKKNRIISSKIDIWSFGILLYWIFCGNYPFQMSNCNKNSQFYNKICTIQPQYPLAMQKQIKQLISKCLNKNPNKRCNVKDFQSMEYFKDIKWDLLKIQLVEKLKKQQNAKQQNKLTNNKIICQLTCQYIKCYKYLEVVNENHEIISTEQYIENIEKQKQNFQKKIKKYRNIQIKIQNSLSNPQKILKISTKTQLGCIKLINISTNNIKMEKINDKQLRLFKINKDKETKQEYQLKFLEFEELQQFISILMKKEN